MNTGFSPWLMIRRLIGFSWGIYALNAVLWPSFFLLPLVPGYLSKVFFDLLEGQKVQLLGWPMNIPGVIGLALGTAVLQILTLFLAMGVNAPFRFRSGSLLRLNMLSRILSLPGAKALPVPVGAALNTLRDDTQEAEDASDWTLDVIGHSAYMTIAIWILARIDATLTLVSIAPLFLVTGISYVFRRRLEVLQRQARETSSHYTALLGETFATVQAIQVAGAERSMLAQLERRSRNRQRAMLQNVALNQALGVFSGNIIAISTGIILLLVASSMRRGEFSVGEFSLFVLYLWEIGHHTAFLGTFVATVRRAGVALGRMMQLMQGAPVQDLLKPRAFKLWPSNLIDNPAPKPPAAAPLEVLRVAGLSYQHPESGRGIHGVDFAIQRGEFVVVTGRIASGKTTLLRTLLGLLPAQNGTVHWNNTLVEDPANFFVPPQSAYTPQVPTLISGSVRDNITLGRPHTHLEDFTDLAVLGPDLKNMPNGLETLVGVRGLKLSGGQTQRVAAARMFAQQPALHVFDDISSALDVETEGLLWQRLFETKATCLVVSHRRAALERADRIVLLQNGSVAGSGSLQDLLATSEEMRAIWSGENTSAP